MHVTCRNLIPSCGISVYRFQCQIISPQFNEAIEISSICIHMPQYENNNLKLGYNGQFPDNIKLIKTIRAFPVDITAIGTLDPRSNAWGYSIGARDSIIGGRITYNREKNSLEYRKALPLPFFGGLTRPVLAAEWELGSDWRRVPRLQIGLAVADDAPSGIDDGATLSNNGTVAFRKKCFLTKRWGVEVDGDMRFHLAHDMAGSASCNSIHLELAAKELNLVLRV